MLPYFCVGGGTPISCIFYVRSRSLPQSTEWPEPEPCGRLKSLDQARRDGAPFVMLGRPRRSKIVQHTHIGVTPKRLFRQCLFVYADVAFRYDFCL
jgi:hypothetical protein